MGQLSRLAAAWPQVARRALANWRLMSTVVIGVMLASAIMAGSVIYFDALRELALQSSLDGLTVNETNILVKSDRGPTTYAERDKVASATEREIDARVGWLLRDRATGVKTSTFFMSEIGRESGADTNSPRTFFGHLPRLYDHATLQPGGRAPGDAPVRVADGIPMVEAAVPLDAAREMGASVGDAFAAVPYWSDSSPYIHVVITGTFTRDDPGPRILASGRQDTPRRHRPDIPDAALLRQREGVLRSRGRDLPADGQHVRLAANDGRRATERRQLHVRAAIRQRRWKTGYPPCCQLPADYRTGRGAVRVRQAAVLLQTAHVRNTNPHIRRHTLLRRHAVVARRRAAAGRDSAAQEQGRDGGASAVGLYLGGFDD